MFEHVEIIPTWDMAEEDWRELRKTGLGGSDAATICGINPYSSPYQLWAERMGLVEGFDGNEATDWGHALETPVADMFAKAEGVTVYQWQVMLHSTKYPWMNANLDGLIGDPHDEGVVLPHPLVDPPPHAAAILEVKTSGIASPGKPYEWFTGDGIPDGYQLQGQWYMGVSGIHKTVYAALVAGHGLQVRELDFDEGLFNDLAEIGRNFWENHILAGIPPEVDGKDATEEALKEVFPRHTPNKAFEGGEKLRQLWESYEVAKAAEKLAIEERKALRSTIVSMLGDAEYGTVEGETICSFRASKDAAFFDDKKFIKDHPRLAKQYMKERAGARQLREVK